MAEATPTQYAYAKAAVQLEYQKLLLMDSTEAFEHFIKLGFSGDGLQDAMSKWAEATGKPILPIIPMQGGPKPYHTSNKDDWGTPLDFYAWLDSQFHFTLDVCADAGNTKCDQYVTADMDALAIQWWGRCFMNPPFSKVGDFMNAMVCAVQAGEIELGVALVAARPDAKWWWNTVQTATEVWFLKGRLKFEGGKHGAPFPSAVLVYWPGRVRERVLLVDWKKGITIPLGHDITGTGS